MKYPKPLKNGDTILLIAPSSPLRTTTAEACASGLEKRGFHVRLGRSLHSSTEKGYAAAPAQVRAADINEGFADDSIDVIWAVCGGSMASEVLPLLDYDLIAKHPKPFLGFSDITALHAVLQGKCGFVSFHAPGASVFGKDPLHPYTESSIKRAMNVREGFTFENSPDWPITVLNSGHAEGILTGGNLSLVTSLIGTEYAIDARGKILFLEDVGEKIYRLDRMLIQLKQSGMFEAAEGVLLGDFTNCPNGYNSEYGPDELLREFFADYKKPVYAHLSVGHITQNGTLPLGAHCIMEAGEVSFAATSHV